MGTNSVGCSFAVLLPQQVQRLLVGVTHRHDHQAAFAKLVDQRLGHFLRAAGDDDLVERRVFGPALKAVADFHVHVAVTQVFERAFGSEPQGLDDFDRVDLLHKAAQHGRLVSAAGANFQHTIAGLRVDGFGHDGDDPG